METSIEPCAEILCQRICTDYECASQFLKRDCPRCGNVFCAHYASLTDQSFCVYCFHDFQIEDSIIRKTIETKSLTGKKTFIRVMKARHIVFKGQDWIFAHTRISTLSDEQLGMSSEYHADIKDQMI